MNSVKPESGFKTNPGAQANRNMAPGPLSKTPDKGVNLAGRSDSRPALKEKTTNLPLVSVGSKEVESLKKGAISQFFQLPEGGKTWPRSRSPLPENKQHIKTEDTAVLSFEFKKDTAVVGKKNSVSNPVEDSPSIKRRKPDKNSGDSLQDPKLNLPLILPAAKSSRTSDPDTPNVQAARKLPSNPGAYQPMCSALYESDPKTENQEYYDEAFREVKDETERISCVEFARMDLQTWTSSGEKLQQEHHAILARLVEARMRLSEKFKVITDLVNERALALNAQGRLLDQKLRRIQDLGKEILDII
ncbi:LAME_0H11694g1_1 [Lachancea meyersii CBS 8951]|uniref:LAME_0H11694g1_1 n=1 Tax=Lachancea meyersii CBS 8951 TaxID=1266667 RepID=A0A1G4KGM8_9SACH|nr:LAME_0H11694g1_1 [Lachancea meyersii CBS 8951]